MTGSLKERFPELANLVDRDASWEKNPGKVVVTGGELNLVLRRMQTLNDENAQLRQDAQVIVEEHRLVVGSKDAAYADLARETSDSETAKKIVELTDALAVAKVEATARVTKAEKRTAALEAEYEPRIGKLEEELRDLRQYKASTESVLESVKTALLLLPGKFG